jgi:mRNA-degrading endonuclease RelE of RelBE toxin-antitoxin system
LSLARAARVLRDPGYEKDVRECLPKDTVWRIRLKRREDAVARDPEHHGYHLSRLNHCKWAAPVERFSIIYRVDKTTTPPTVTLLAFYEPKNQ